MAPHTIDNAQKKKHKSDEKLKQQEQQAAAAAVAAAAVVLNLQAGEEITGLTRDEMASVRGGSRRAVCEAVHTPKVGSVPTSRYPTYGNGNSRWVRRARRRMSGVVTLPHRLLSRVGSK
ncbi:unnamed protein product [Ectocarpus sp. 12 AP-2014]